VNLSLDKKVKRKTTSQSPQLDFVRVRVYYQIKLEVINVGFSGERIGETGHLGEILLEQKVRTNSKLIPLMPLNT